MLEQPDEKHIRLYLLGALPETEIERLDELSVADDAFAEQLSAVENDLVDGYASGDLPPDMAEAFRAVYLASPRRGDKARFAEAFLAFQSEAVSVGARQDASSGPPPGRAPERKQRSIRLMGTPRLGWVLAAAALVLVVGVIYLALENLRLNKQLSRDDGERAGLAQRETELERQIENGRADRAKTTEELNAVRDRLAQLEQRETARQHGHPESNGSEGIVAFALAPPTRGAGPIPTRSIPAGTRIVTIELELESADFPEYQATLRNSASQVIWKGWGLRPASKGQNKSTTLKLPAARLKGGIYNLELSGARKGGIPEIVATYPFMVVVQ